LSFERGRHKSFGDRFAELAASKTNIIHFVSGVINLGAVTRRHKKTRLHTVRFCRIRLGDLKDWALNGTGCEHIF